MSPGNPIQAYMKCYLEQYRFVFDGPDFDRRKMLLAMPLEEFPAREIPQLGRNALAQADRAARLDNPEWQVLLKLNSDGISTLLPDVQAMRTLARASQVRFRAEVDGGRIDLAIGTAKTMLALGRRMGEHPTQIGTLVAIAITNVALFPLEAMLEHPACPNLYWALANLPDPFISTTKATAGERLMVEMMFRDLDRTVPMSALKLERAIDELDTLIGENLVNKKSAGIRAHLATRTKVAATMAAAAERLIAWGLPEACVKQFPPEQLILLDEAHECLAQI